MEECITKLGLGAKISSWSCYELFDTFGKKHAIHPTHLITATKEYSKADDSSPDEDVQEEIKQFSVTSAGKTKAYCASTKKGKTDENYDQLDTQPCKKRSRYIMNVTPSQDSVKEKHHQENLKRKDEYIGLKSEELKLKKEILLKELAIKEESKKEFLQIQKMKQTLEAQKLQAQYPNYKFDLPQE
ncbi:hypothetical protein QAD02_019128 [Eretmocerus hayati]|uniref:Uncharacterized protein n=1 Tax=Eretmocerus hayati TaxID=131215 RepID=A0ACC2PKJ7_9HYME|nr:hypothetical protein QAD02_019128 [Eretmocerus hayati]